MGDGGGCGADSVLSRGGGRRRHRIGAAPNHSPHERVVRRPSPFHRAALTVTTDSQLRNNEKTLKQQEKLETQM